MAPRNRAKSSVASARRKILPRFTAAKPAAQKATHPTPYGLFSYKIYDYDNPRDIRFSARDILDAPLSEAHPIEFTCNDSGAFFSYGGKWHACSNHPKYKYPVRKGRHEYETSSGFHFSGIDKQEYPVKSVLKFGVLTAVFFRPDINCIEYCVDDKNTTLHFLEVRKGRLALFDISKGHYGKLD
ncbi:MAG TPA: hypothetical protein VJH23_03375 [archaeon]|nr:hypothetical protein [archaeon]